MSEAITTFEPLGTKEFWPTLALGMSRYEEARKAQAARQSQTAQQGEAPEDWEVKVITRSLGGWLAHQCLMSGLRVPRALQQRPPRETLPYPTDLHRPHLPAWVVMPALVIEGDEPTEEPRYSEIDRLLSEQSGRILVPTHRRQTYGTEQQGSDARSGF